MEEENLIIIFTYWRVKIRHTNDFPIFTWGILYRYSDLNSSINVFIIIKDMVYI